MITPPQALTGSLCFQDADAAFMVGAFPRKEGMERKDLLAKNIEIFKVPAQLDAVYHKIFGLFNAVHQEENLSAPRKRYYRKS
jgi:hypothetical protein